MIFAGVAKIPWRISLRRNILDVISEANDEILEAFRECCEGHKDATSNTMATHAGLALVRYMWQRWGIDPVGFGFDPDDLDAVLSSGD